MAFLSRWNGTGVRNEFRFTTIKTTERIPFYDHQNDGIWALGVWNRLIRIIMLHERRATPDGLE